MNNPHTSPLCLLKEQACFSATGKDSANFLQNMLTNDLRAIQAGKFQISALCSREGRVICIFHILPIQTNFFLLLTPQCMLEEAIKLLNFYKLRMDVQFKSENLRAFGVIGADNAQTHGLNYFQTLPEQVFDFVHHNQNYLMRLPSKKPLYQLIQANEPALSRPTEDAIFQWKKAQIKSGMATITKENSTQFTPQQIGLDQIGGVSFTKGCYPGQEVVARMHFLSKKKHQLYIFEGQASQDPMQLAPSSSHLINQTTLGEKKCALLVSTNTMDTKIFQKVEF